MTTIKEVEFEFLGRMYNLQVKEREELLELGVVFKERFFFLWEVRRDFLHHVGTFCSYSAMIKHLAVYAQPPIG